MSRRIPSELTHLILSLISLDYLVDNNICKHFSQFWSARYQIRYGQDLQDTRFSELPANELYLLKAGYEYHEVATNFHQFSANQLPYENRYFMSIERKLYAAIKSENWACVNKIIPNLPSDVSAVITKAAIESDQISVVQKLMPRVRTIPRNVIIKSDAMGIFLVESYVNDHGQMPPYRAIFQFCSAQTCTYLFELLSKISFKGLWCTLPMFYTQDKDKVAYALSLEECYLDRPNYLLNQIGKYVIDLTDDSRIDYISRHMLFTVCPNITTQLLQYPGFVQTLNSIVDVDDTFNIVYDKNLVEIICSMTPHERIRAMIQVCDQYKDESPILYNFYLLFKTVIGTLDIDDIKQFTYEYMARVCYDICVRLRKFDLIILIHNNCQYKFDISQYAIYDEEFALFCLQLTPIGNYSFVTSISFIDKVKNNKSRLALTMAGTPLLRLI